MSNKTNLLPSLLLPYLQIVVFVTFPHLHQQQHPPLFIILLDSSSRSLSTKGNNSIHKFNNHNHNILFPLLFFVSSLCYNIMFFLQSVFTKWLFVNLNSSPTSPLSILLTRFISIFTIYSKQTYSLTNLASPKKQTCISLFIFHNHSLILLLHHRRSKHILVKW